MMTEEQMYIEYIKTQEKRLLQLEEEKKRIEKDIDNVKNLMLISPYKKE